METPNKSLKRILILLDHVTEQKCFTAYSTCAAGSPRWNSAQAFSHIHHDPDDPDGSSRQSSGMSVAEVSVMHFSQKNSFKVELWKPLMVGADEVGQHIQEMEKHHHCPEPTSWKMPEDLLPMVKCGETPACPEICQGACLKDLLSLRVNCPTAPQVSLEGRWKAMNAKAKDPTARRNVQCRPRWLGLVSPLKILIFPAPLRSKL